MTENNNRRVGIKMFWAEENRKINRGDDCSGLESKSFLIENYVIF